MLSIFAGLFTIAILALLRWKPWRVGKREQGLSPGPPTTLIIGNATQIPTSFPQLKFTEWARKFGEIYSLKVLNQTIVVLSSPRAIKEILDKQGSKTSDRIALHMASRVDSYYMPNHNADSPLWKASRKAVTTLLNVDALERHLPAHITEVSQLLNDVLDSPEDIYTHIKRMLASTMSQPIYGKRLPQYKGTAEDIFHAIHMWSGILDLTAHPPVDFLPFLKYVPARWAPWKELCDRTSQVREAVYGRLFSECEAGIQAGERTGSFLEQVILKQDTLGMSRDAIRGLSHVLMDGGSQTSTDFLHNLVLVLLNYPECQDKAKAEVDLMIGRDRLPTAEDLDHLPYLRALIKEVFRFRPIVPTGFPHVASADVKYRNYNIPAGSMIMSNIWGIYRDPNFFEDPETFNPDRYIHSEFGTRTDIEVDTEGFRHSIPFGSGRRICPGMNLALQIIEISTMNLIWAFTFSKDNSGTGTMDLDSYLKPGVEMTPAPFTCNVAARGEKTARMIKDWYSRTLVEDNDTT